MKRIIALTLVASFSLGLGACENASRKHALKYDAHYWQRANVTEAIYMDGPKSQQMLNRDISRCVTELRELEILGSLRNAIPADHNAPPSSTPEGNIAEWETPEREGMLRAEHLPYHDFESCMIYHGWERVEYLPYDVSERARANYTETIIGERYRTETRKRQSPLQDTGDDFDNLND